MRDFLLVTGEKSISTRMDAAKKEELFFYFSGVEFIFTASFSNPKQV